MTLEWNTERERWKETVFPMYMCQLFPRKRKQQTIQFILKINSRFTNQVFLELLTTFHYHTLHQQGKVMFTVSVSDQMLHACPWGLTNVNIFYASINIHKSLLSSSLVCTCPSHSVGWHGATCQSVNRQNSGEKKKGPWWKPNDDTSAHTLLHSITSGLKLTGYLQLTLKTAEREKANVNSDQNQRPCLC